MRIILLTVLFLNTVIPSFVSAEENQKAEESYEWYIPQEADKQLPWNSHDPWNEWGSSISLGLTLNQSMAFKSIDDSSMTGVVIGFNSISLSYQSNDTFKSYRLEVLSNKTFLADKLSLDLYNPDIRVSLMSPVLFIQLTGSDSDDNAVGLLSGVDILNVRAVYEDFVFVQLSLASYVVGFENPGDLEEDDEEGFFEDFDDEPAESIKGFQGSFRILVGVSF